MSQYYPPQGDEPQQQSEGHRPEHNPYMGAHEQRQAPDPNAGAATLSNADMRRMNRKALLFLGGIVFLLLLMAFWLMHSLSNRGDKKDENQPKVEEVATPDDAPQLAQQPALAQESMPAQPVPLEPPLPPPPSTEVAPYRPEYYDQPRQSNAASAQPVISGPQPPTLVERRMQDGGMSAGAPPATAGGQTGQVITSGPLAGMALPPGYVIGPDGQPMQAPAGASAGQPGAPSAAFTANTPRIGRAQRLSNPDTLLLRGTYVRCVLETRIVTDIPGFTSCIVAEPVYSVNGRRLLVDRGSKLVGSYQTEAIARGRVGVIWDRITTPSGFDISMASPGIDNLGGAGHVGQFNSHWPSRIASAVMISLIADAFKYYGAEKGPRSTVVTPGGTIVDQPYQSETAQTVQQLARQAVDSSANRKPTVTINQGTVVNVYINKDVDFSGVLGSR